MVLCGTVVHWSVIGVNSEASLVTLDLCYSTRWTVEVLRLLLRTAMCQGRFQRGRMQSNGLWSSDAQEGSALWCVLVQLDKLQDKVKCKEYSGDQLVLNTRIVQWYSPSSLPCRQLGMSTV